MYPSEEPTEYGKIVYMPCIGYCTPRLKCIWTWDVADQAWYPIDIFCIDHEACNACPEPSSPGTFEDEVAITECQ
jgi:hypothetical protein